MTDDDDVGVDDDDSDCDGDDDGDPIQTEFWNKSFRKGKPQVVIHSWGGSNAWKRGSRGAFKVARIPLKLNRCHRRLSPLQQSAIYCILWLGVIIIIIIIITIIMAVTDTN